MFNQENSNSNVVRLYPSCHHLKKQLFSKQFRARNADIKELLVNMKRLDKQFRARNAEILFFACAVAVITVYFAVVTVIQDRNWRSYLDSLPLSQEEVITLTPEEIEARNADWRISDYHLASYEFCQTMDNPYPLFFPLLEFEARFTGYIGLNDLKMVGEYVEFWNEAQRQQREFKKKFIAATAEYEDRLKIMSLEEFRSAALNWWFNSVSGTPENWRDYYDAADAPLVTLDAENLYYTSKAIAIVAGGDYISQEVKMWVGQVFLNRITSPNPLFPDTAREVFFQPSQYNTAKLLETKPSRMDLESALALLTTSEEILPADVLYCSTTPIGEIYSQVTIPELGTSLYFGTD